MSRQACLPASPEFRTQNSSAFRWIVFGNALLGAVVGCAPLQYGSDQVPEINVSWTEAKHNQFVGMPAGVDAIVGAYLGEPGAPPGCAIGIMENNAISHLKGYGFADLGTSRPFTHATPSVVGSVSKTWTALAALRLQELGLLDLQDTVGDLLHDPPAGWGPITLEQLLSHTSGLQRDPVFDPFLNTTPELNSFLGVISPTFPYTGIHPKLVYYCYQQTPVIGFDPGSTARYSNAGYILAGAAIDRTISQNSATVGFDYSTYESFVWRYVGVGQMISECLWEDWRNTDIKDLAKGYRYDGPGYTQLTHLNSSILTAGPLGWEGPAGDWTMTIGDLVRLMVAIQNDEIISNATKSNLMMQVYGSDSNGNWGLGVNLISKLGRPVYMHDGLIAGYRARYTVWPTENFGVAIMANEEDADTRDITDAIAALFIGGSPTLVPAASSRMVVAGVPDDNDPGFGGDTSSVHVTPPLSAGEQQVISQQHVQLSQGQLAEELRRIELQTTLEAEGCGLILQNLVDQHGVDITDVFQLCLETSESEAQFDACVEAATNDLVARMLISPDEALDLQNCARIVYCSQNNCGTALPATSSWGLVILALSLTGIVAVGIVRRRGHRQSQV